MKELNFIKNNKKISALILLLLLILSNCAVGGKMFLLFD